MIVILSPDNSLKTFINVQLILARYQARFSIFTFYVSSSVLSYCSIKHDDDDDERGNVLRYSCQSRYHFRHCKQRSCGLLICYVKGAFPLIWSINPILYLLHAINPFHCDLDVSPAIHYHVSGAGNVL